ncbi:MAG: LacI family DNA-binding transcriptional regulator [Eubacteriales bacterium]|nr:LacI family DNA-binding transcriptional regulator [Eubacteriales bacterium]
MTIKDIARESGYSVGTVSRVLNHSPGVSEKARETIMEVVEKYHFHLNSNAKHLKKQSRDGIAIIIKGAQNMLFAAIVEQMQGLIRRKDYACMVYYLDEDDDELEQANKICTERRPLGILFLGSNLEYFRQRFSYVTVPCVLVTNSAEGLGFDNLSSVGTDDEEAAKFAIEYLFSLGHTNIGILGGKMPMSQASFSRYEGCRRAFAENGVMYEPAYQYEAAHFSISEGYYAMGRLLDKMPDITAVFAMSDVMAVGAIRAIQDRGLRVPEDISVIGFDGIDIGNYMVPRLTTIRQHREGIASRSVEILLQCIEDDMAPVYEVEPFHLISGESVRAR